MGGRPPWDDAGDHQPHTAAEPFDRGDEAQTEWVAWTALSAHGVRDIADRYLEQTHRDLKLGPEFVLQVPSGSSMEPEMLGRASGPHFRCAGPGSLGQSSLVHVPNLCRQMAQMHLCGQVCRRGGDMSAASLLLTEAKATVNLPRMLAERDYIENLALLLVTGRSVEPGKFREALGL